MKDKKRIFIFVFLEILVFVAISTLARIIIEFDEVYKLDFSQLSSISVKSYLMSFSTYKILFTRTDNMVVVVGIAALGWYNLSFLLHSITNYKKRNTFEESENYASHGTSRFQTEEEIKEDYYREGAGWFLGSYKKEKFTLGMKAAKHNINNPSELNMQITVIGPPGSNKTTGLVLPTIFNLVDSHLKLRKRVEKTVKLYEKIQSKFDSGVLKIIPWIYKRINKKKIEDYELPDLVITDPKPEIYIRTAKYLEDNNYDVKVFDFIDLLRGDSLNILDFIDDEKTLMQVAKGYIDSIDSSDDGASKGEQQFWNDQEAQVLAALIGLIKQKYPEERQTLAHIAKLLTSKDVADIDNAQEFFEKMGVTGAPKQLWDNFLMLAESERTRSNILGGLAEKLKLFAISGIQNITNTSTVDIRKLGTKKDKPMALFIMIPDDDRTFAPIINTFITTTFKQLYKTARKTKARLEVPVYYLLEEMANIGKIPNIKQMLGGMRGRRIYPMMIWQSLAQMKDRYGDKGAEDILSMCDTTVYLGVNDQVTAEYCSNSLGNTTIRIHGESSQNDGGLMSIDQRSENQSYMQRKLKFPEECKLLPNSQMFLIQRSKQPSILYKTQYQYWESPICEDKEVDEIPYLKRASNVEYITPDEFKKEEPSKAVEKDIETDKMVNNDNPFNSAKVDETLLEKFLNEDESFS